MVPDDLQPRTLQRERARSGAFRDPEPHAQRQHRLHRHRREPLRLRHRREGTHPRPRVRLELPSGRRPGGSRARPQDGHHLGHLRAWPDEARAPLHQPGHVHTRLLYRLLPDRRIRADLDQTDRHVRHDADAGEPLLLSRHDGELVEAQAQLVHLDLGRRRPRYTRGHQAHHRARRPRQDGPRTLLRSGAQPDQPRTPAGSAGDRPRGRTPPRHPGRAKKIYGIA